MVSISPDGRHLYVAGGIGNAVVVFSRNAATGQLTFVESQLDGVAGVDGLASAWSVAVSPDGANVYATGMADHAVAVFARDAASGRLAFVEALFDGAAGIDGLGGAWLVAVAPDGATLYVAGATDDAIAVFRRNANGTLTFVEAETDGVGEVDGLDGAGGVTPSPDGAHVYATGLSDRAVAAFAVTSCGNARTETGECCDLGDDNGAVGSGCTAACSCVGRCTGTGTECAATSACTEGAGCCGNGLLEGDEQCDDGNLADGDCCTQFCQQTGAECIPTCAGVSGPHLRPLPPTSLRLEDRTGDGLFERWRLRFRGPLVLGPGQSVDPAAEDFRLVVAESDGAALPMLQVVAEFGLGADQCGGSACWDRCRRSRGIGRCGMRDAGEMRSEPDGIRVARLVERSTSVKGVFGGRMRARIPQPRTDRVRICVHVGDTAVTRVLGCRVQQQGRVLRCR